MSTKSVAFGMDKEYYNNVKQRLVLLLKFWFYIRAEGLENIPEKGPVLIATKHCHIIDPAVMCEAIERQIYGVSKDANLEIPFLGPRLKRMGMYPIDRDNLTMKNFTDFMSLLEQGNILGYAPEMSRFSNAVAKLHPELTYYADQWQNRKRWRSDEITHILLGIDYPSTPWLLPRASIIVRAEKFDVSSYKTLDDLAEAMGHKLAELSGLDYMPEKYDYYLKYADRLTLRTT